MNYGSQKNKNLGGYLDRAYSLRDDLLNSDGQT